MLAYFQSSNQGRLYVGQWGTCLPPDSLVAPIRPRFKSWLLADRSDVIYEVQNAPKSKFFRAPSRTPLRKLTALPYRPLTYGKGHTAPPPPPRTSPRSRPRFYGSQGPAHYRVGNRTNDIDHGLCGSNKVLYKRCVFSIGGAKFDPHGSPFPAYRVLAKRLLSGWLSGWLVGKSCLSRVSLSVRAEGGQARVCHGRRA